MDESDLIFKALSDPHRRLLLDRLHERDGQTLTELQTYLPMSRFGCMKHLRVLEDAGLVATNKVGREKHHYLNPVPIQQLYDRWVSKYARPWTLALTELKYTLEEASMSQPTHVYHIFIRSTPEQLWQALTNGAMTRQYYFGTAVESDWQPGSAYRYATPDGGSMIEGQVLEADPPRRLVTTFKALWTEEGRAAPPSTVTYDITPAGDACKLTLTHDGLVPGAGLTAGIIEGWAQILSGLKTLLETGEPLPIGG